MAKGLRSKSKLSARNIKRTDPRSDYAVIHAARLAATSGRLAKRNRSSIKAGDEDDGDDAMEADVRGEGEEEEEGNAAKDVSEAAERGAQEGEVDKGWYMTEGGSAQDSSEDIVGSSNCDSIDSGSEDLQWLLLGLCNPEDIYADGVTSQEDANAVECLTWLLKA